MTMVAASALLKMIYSSLIASVAVALVFSIAVYGAVRSGDMRRAGRPSAATAYATLAGCGLLLSIAIVIYGLILVAHKT
jgi:hypothetical protein